MNALLRAVDELYEGVVSAPVAWNEQRFTDWTDQVASSEDLDKATSRAVRRIITAARKLQAFWEGSPPRDDLDWRSRVDLALGPRAWRPVLELAEALLVRHGDEEAFHRTADLFRVVHNEPYLDGITFEEWSVGHGG